LWNLGSTAYHRKEYTAAKRFYQEALALARELGGSIYVGGRLTDLGDAAFASGEYEEACDFYQQALTEWEKMGNPPRARARSLTGRGNASVAVGDGRGARQYYRQALEIAVDRHLWKSCLDAVVGLAALLAQKGELDRSVELAVVVLHHADCTVETKDKASELLEDLQARLAPDVYAAAQERGRARDLEATVKELLAELE
jgi:tetratricopeptide (TPR) repeat protein